MARIAVIGWGSLIWDLDDLAEKVTGAWALGAGPALPLEFSRISAKRLRALAVVIDPAHGAVARSAVIASARADLATAAADLAARERAPVERIGFVGPSGARSSVPGVAERVDAWRRTAGWDGAVWTDLPPNFAAEAGAPFSVAAGIAHLKTLSGAPLVEAKRYVARAPAETDTPLRRALDADPWWRELPES